jgi:hypothetical protein
LPSPLKSLAIYYNWCLEQTRFSHVCKWDADMIAMPVLELARGYLPNHDVVIFAGHDVLGQHTTDMEPRIFRFDSARARYVDWDLYEVLRHDYSRQVWLQEKCYMHMKLVKREWLHRSWSSPNLPATRPVPETGAAPLPSALPAVRALAGRVTQRLCSAMQGAREAPRP